MINIRVVLLLLMLIRVNRSEEQTVLKDATTVDVCLQADNYSIDLIQGAFRMQVTCSVQYDEQEFIIKLTSSKHILAVFILAYERPLGLRKRIINTYVYIGDSVKCT